MKSRFWAKIVRYELDRISYMFFSLFFRRLAKSGVSPDRNWQTRLWAVKGSLEFDYFCFLFFVHNGKKSTENPTDISFKKYFNPLTCKVVKNSIKISEKKANQAIILHKMALYLKACLYK